MVNMQLTTTQAQDLAWILKAFRGDVPSTLVGSFLIQEEEQELLDALRIAINHSALEEVR